MKTNQFIFAAFTAAFLSVANYAAAQVTIGGSDLPKAGTILDLNSTTKGGLALSNVSLTDLNTIPVGFPGINSPTDVTPEVKAKLTGAIVYNINSDICLGVYVWDGNLWRKLDKDYQVKAAGSGELQIPSMIEIENENVILADEDVTLKFTAPEGVQFYNWYKNDTYLATTITPEYTSNFPVGSHTIKVELDNCRSLSESGITFKASKVYPASLPVATGGLIYILSADAFPYAKTDEYEQDGLVAHYDGINNTGEGDELHDSSATTWKDLSGNGNHLTNNNNAGAFDATGYIFVNANNYWRKTSPVGIPTGNNSFTVEMRYNFAGTFATGTVCSVSWGVMGNSTASCTGFRGTNTLAHAFWNNDINITFPNAQTADNTLTVTYEAGTGTTYQQTARTAYGNATQLSYASMGGSHQWKDPNISSGYPLIVGGAPNGIGGHNNANLRIQSVRIYNRVLEKEEIDANFALDEMRYIANPTVTVAGQPCTNVAVLSRRVLTCLAPAISPAGPVEIIVTGADNEIILTLNQGELEYQ
ncbi:MAG: IPT/TIG domain-containing protein [Prevotellaceae bacterium]|nr:IPT/TIG domain-containing protein [Prevotellaceae bacterium]